MKVEKLEKELLNQCVAKYRLVSTHNPNLQGALCSGCNTRLISMRIDRSPNKGSGAIRSNDKFRFYGCPNCNTVSYDESELLQFLGKESNLIDYLHEHIF